MATPQNKLYTAQEVAEMFGVTRHTVHRFVTEYGLKCVKLGPDPRSTVRFTQEDLDDFINARKEGK